MTDRSAPDPYRSHDDDTADDSGPEPRHPKYLAEGTEAHAEVPGGPQSDVPLLRGPSDRPREGT